MSNENDDRNASPPTSKPGRPAGFSLSQEPLIAGEIPLETSPAPARPATVAEAPAAPPSGPDYEDLGELPATYHEDTLFVIARDPRWLFAYWDFDWSRIPKDSFRYGVPVFHLRILNADGSEEATHEIKPEARNWYIPVGTPASAYSAQLGFFNESGGWTAAVTSGTAATPPDALAEESQPVEFATAPAALTFEQMLELLNDHMEEGESLLKAAARITAGNREIAFRPGQAPVWTDEQRRLLAALLGSAIVDTIGLGSAEIDELLRKQLIEKLQQEGASGIGPAWQRAVSQPEAESSLFSGVMSWGASWAPQVPAAQRGFFMHVNAEVIFYGGTHPDATVWIDGKPIALQPDGTFRHHFRMPDGEWAIPIVAQSPDGAEQRSATLSFLRGTTRTGDVGATAQPQELASEPMGRK